MIISYKLFKYSCIESTISTSLVSGKYNKRKAIIPFNIAIKRNGSGKNRYFKIVITRGERAAPTRLATTIKPTACDLKLKQEKEIKTRDKVLKTANDFEENIYE